MNFTSKVNMFFLVGDWSHICQLQRIAILLKEVQCCFWYGAMKDVTNVKRQLKKKKGSKNSTRKWYQKIKKVACARVSLGGQGT
jgi:hypothetical protein